MSLIQQKRWIKAILNFLDSTLPEQSWEEAQILNIEYTDMFKILTYYVSYITPCKLIRNISHVMKYKTFIGAVEIVEQIVMLHRK